MCKAFVLDTNVLLNDPDSIFSFEDNDVVIALAVLRELERFKTELTERGRNARQVIRVLDDLRNEGGNLSSGIQLDGGGTLRVDTTGAEQLLKSTKADDLLIPVIKRISDGGQETVLLTQDIAFRVKADALGIKVQEYRRETCRTDYSGLVGPVDIDDEFIDSLFEKKTVSANLGQEFLSNQFVLIRSFSGKSGIMMHIGNDTFELVSSHVASSVRPKNLEQTCALHALLNDNIRIVTLKGKAGTGKTLLAACAALQQVWAEKRFDRMLVARPVIPMGKDIGYLPGDMYEKMTPWMQPIYDASDIITGIDRKSGRSSLPAKSFDEFMDIVPLTYIRGRSLAHSFIIIDECQNTTRHEIKTILTRVGQQSKIVLTGDVEQIDCPYLSESTNGLSYVIEKLKGQTLFAHVTLTKSERSKVAELAANVL